MHVFHAVLFNLKAAKCADFDELARCNDLTKTQDMSEFDKNAMCGVFTEKTRMDDLIEK